MNIRKKLLLMNISIISIGMFANMAHAYQPIYGNDYANISAFGLNENDFQKDNIIQKDGNFTNINIPKPKGTVNINILGAKRTINLDDDEEKRLNKRKRYYKIQQNKKRQRLEDQRQAELLRAEQDALDEQQAIEAQAKKFEEDKRKNDLALQKSYEQNQNQRNFPSEGGFIPSTPPLGLPRY